MISVTITDKDGTSTTSTFDKNEIVIGRVNGNDIVLPKVNVTKRHARIVKMTGKTVLIDMKSREGIFVNGYRISNPCQLYEGDKFFIGDYTLEVHEPDKNAPPPLDPDVVKVFNAYFNIPNTPSPKPAETPLEPCIDIHARDKQGQTPLHTCSNAGVAKLLIDAGADVNARDKEGQTPLHTCRNAGVAKILIAAGADVNARDNRGRAPLHMPICWNDNVVKLLVAAGADVNIRDNEGQTPLHICEHVAMARALIEAGADLNVKDNAGQTPLHTYHGLPILEVLIKAGSNIHAKDKDGKTLLHKKCVDYHDYDAAKVLIDAGADVNVRDENGQTLLHLCKSERTAKALIEAGADVNAKNNEGQTPLYCKINRWERNDRDVDIAVLKCLIDAGANVNVKDPKGQTPLHTCEYDEAAKLFIAAGANVNAKDNEGKTPLHTCKNMNVLKALIAAGADVNAKDNTGKSPLHTCSNIYAAFELVKAGADIHAKDNEGNSALNIDQIKKMIKVFGKDMIRMGRACWKVINALHDALKSIHELEVNAQATKADDAKADNAKADAVKAAADAFLEEATFIGIRAAAMDFLAAQAEASDAAKANLEIITFGHYKQDGDTSKGKEPITWIVLDKNDKGQYLIISEKVLDMKPYNTTMVPITWEKSTIRSWLNGYGASSNTDGNDYANDNFIDTAFTAEEKARIVASNIQAHLNTSPDNVTMDKIFLLSIQEANDYFASDAKRWADATNYAIQNGVKVENIELSNGFVHHYGGWWLRSPGFANEFASYVDENPGSINGSGMGVDFDRIGVRPALWIDNPCG